MALSVPKSKRALVTSPRADPVVGFVTEVLRQNGGSFGMAALSGLIKRNRPELRSAMGPIRRCKGPQLAPDPMLTQSTLLIVDIYSTKRL
eukprot:4119911-Pyramimonas_sp.AAC.1